MPSSKPVCIGQLARFIECERSKATKLVDRLVYLEYAQQRALPASRPSGSGRPRGASPKRGVGRSSGR